MAYDNYPAEAQAKNAVVGIGMINPTLQENIDQKIKYHQDEILRLQKIAAQIPEQMLSMNLRDLREAMQF